MTGYRRRRDVEARLGDRWAVVDATYGRVWQRDDDGELLTADQLAADWPLFERLASTLPNYPTDRFGYRNVFRLRVEKVPGLKRLRGPMRSWLGDDFVRSINTPYIYERPQFLVANVFFAIGTIALGVNNFLAGNDLL